MSVSYLGFGSVWLGKMLAFACFSGFHLAEIQAIKSIYLSGSLRVLIVSDDVRYGTIRYDTAVSLVGSWMRSLFDGVKI